MSFDTFVGLAANASIQGATWDSGDLSWANPTYLVGDGNGNVKPSASVPAGFFVLGNFTHEAATTGARAFFKMGAGRDIAYAAIGISIQGDGSASDYGAGGAIIAHAGEYGSVTVRQQGGAGPAMVNGITFDPAQEYCLEVFKTTNPSGLEYQAKLYASTNGVINGAALYTTPLLTIASARPGTALLSQIQRGGNASTMTPNLTISRVETLAPAPAPVLSAPSATPTSSSTATATVNTDKAGGALYYLVGAAASDANTTKSSGSSQTVTGTGQQTVNLTGLPAGTARVVTFVQVDSSGGTSNVVSASFTTPAPDTVAPTFPNGSAITPGAVTANSISGTYPAATDNVAVTGYRYSINSGATWTDNGTGLTYNINGLAASTTYPVWIEAKDAAGNYSTPLQTTQATSAPTTGSFKSSKLGNNTASGWAAGTAVKWEWHQGGRIGSAPTSVTRGAGTLAADGTLTVSGVPIGAGILYVARWAATFDLDDVYAEPGTVA